MHKKKQGSLSARTLKLRSQKSLQKDHTQNESKIKFPSSINLISVEANEFIEHYQMLKQQHNFNLSSKNLFEETQFCDNNDDEFCFDVDLGVPYAESQHLDSGFQYDERASEAVNFPKVSSAKEIFTSVLDISKADTNELDQENFTDQEDNEQKELDKSSKSSSQFQKRSRKQVLPLLENLENFEEKQKLFPTEKFIFDDEETLMMQKLKATAQNREKKLKFWNTKLFELNKPSSNLSQNNSKVTVYTNQENSSIRINENSVVSIKNTQVQVNQVRKSPIKRSKFEKQPTIKRQKVNLRIESKQNLSPLNKKIVQVKKITLNQKEQGSKMETIMRKLKANKENEQNYATSMISYKNMSDRRHQILGKKNLKSRSKEIKEKSLTKRVL